MMEWQYSNIEREVQYILYGLKKFCHYCFTRDVYAVTDHKPPVAMVSKDLVMLSQQLYCIMLFILQYILQIKYKPGSDIHSDSLSQYNHVVNQDQDILVLNIRLPTISTSVDVSIFTLKEDIKAASEEEGGCRC